MDSSAEQEGAKLCEQPSTAVNSAIVVLGLGNILLG